ncbi:MAG: GntR family transcriptional regulator [Clostridia bacterium]|nr:GntR family transcriptional regulator [Clostridia bacterium]
MINRGTASLEARVYGELQDAILQGIFHSGEALTENALSERLGVSRTPVRGALSRLSEEGLVELVPNRGAVVIGITEEDIVDIYRIRMRLEGLASAMAAEKITEGDKRALIESVELAEFYGQKNDAEHIKELDTAFHKAIFRASGSRTLERILTDLHRNTKAYRRVSLTIPGRPEQSTAEHREILNAILRGDAAEADRLTSLHIEHALANMLVALRNATNET